MTHLHQKLSPQRPTLSLSKALNDTGMNLLGNPPRSFSSKEVALRRKLPLGARILHTRDDFKQSHVNVITTNTMSRRTTFSQSARLFDAVENALKIRIQNLPPWLKAIDLARTVTIYGAEMRRIKIPQIMQDLDMQKLSGLATFLVLCCRYTESDEVMVSMLKSLLKGHLGCLVKTDGNQQNALPYSFHGHLGSFVRSCVDADKDSNVSRRAQEWIASLHVDDKGGKPEIGLAMEFTIYAIAIQVLRNTLSPAGDSADIYALNLSTLTREESETSNLINFV
ncbi:hypothetical protein FAUST_6146 [Fusarium austroamericanum]|uniref:Uncharacterized protein n=1 Tax=Fusarium austroamericanum TaxID=282268 RepID=A0AAN6HDZ5_FUSAU|nr:hypothetical protein FAUST_6146 [Fusarium austroamericanum]